MVEVSEGDGEGIAARAVEAIEVARAVAAVTVAGLGGGDGGGDGGGGEGGGERVMVADLKRRRWRGGGGA